MKHKLVFLVSLFVFSVISVFAQTSAFTYQGRLTANNSAANGTYDFEFALFDAPTNGTPQPQPNPVTVSRPGISVSNGVFSVQLDFTAAAFPGADRYLEIRVKKPLVDNNFVILTSRQQITGTPYALRTLTAATADGLSTACNLCVTDAHISTVDGSKITGSVSQANNATTATTANNALSLGGLTADNYLQKSGGTITGNLSVGGVLSGDGSGLTNLPASGGGGFQWQSVAGAAVQAQSNQGYIAGNDAAQVVVTLPINPSVGDVVRVAGAGAGGWRISQNANQFISGSNLGISPWTPRESIRSWQAVASSSDGTKLVAVVQGGQIYTSTDSGATWTPRESNRIWRAVASSSDGTKLVAVVQDGQIYTSTDSGATWTPRESNRNWTSVASSSDGTKLFATSNAPYTSTDSGVTWTQRDNQGSSPYSVASSADGTKLVGVVNGNGYIYTSTDSGVTWTRRESQRNWFAVASSADGTKLVAVVFSGQIYTSTDSGATWTPRESNRNWISVASSSDGTKLIAAVVGGQIYTSTDSGLSWTPRENNRLWYSVASSSDGTKLVGVVYNGQIYTAAYGASSTGTAGYLTGAQSAAVELLYVGGGKFVIVSSQGAISNF